MGRSCVARILPACRSAPTFAQRSSITCEWTALRLCAAMSAPAARSRRGCRRGPTGCRRICRPCAFMVEKMGNQQHTSCASASDAGEAFSGSCPRVDGSQLIAHPPPSRSGLHKTVQRLERQLRPDPVGKSWGDVCGKEARRIFARLPHLDNPPAAFDRMRCMHDETGRLPQRRRSTLQACRRNPAGVCPLTSEIIKTAMFVTPQKILSRMLERSAREAAFVEKALLFRPHVRPRIGLRCGKRPKRRTMSRWRSA